MRNGEKIDRGGEGRVRLEGKEGEMKGTERKRASGGGRGRESWRERSTEGRWE